MTCFYHVHFIYFCCVFFSPLLLFIFLLFYSLEFDLIVYAPYQSVKGYVNDMEVNVVFFFFFLMWILQAMLKLDSSVFSWAFFTFL